MTVATLTAKGQITLPKPLRDQLHLHAGDKIDFLVDPKKGIAVMAPVGKRVAEVFGMLSHIAPKKPVSIEEMNTAIANRMKAKHT